MFVSVYAVVSGPTTPTRAQPAPPPWRQMAKAISLLLLSVQARVTCDPDSAVVTSPVGAAGRLGVVTATTLLQSEAPTALIARTR